MLSSIGVGPSGKTRDKLALTTYHAVRLGLEPIETEVGTVLPYHKS